MRNNIKFSMLKSILCTMAFSLLLPFGCVAAEVALPPDAGQILKEQKQNITGVTKTKPNMSAETVVDNQDKATNITQNTESVKEKVHVNSIEIADSSCVMKPIELQMLTAEYSDKDMTFAELQQATEKISKYYQDRGYILATAYLPEQEISKGNIQVNVIVGTYASVQLNNKSAVLDYILRNQMTQLKAGRYVNKMEIDRALLLMNDMPQVYAKATLVKGKTAGTVDLIIDVEKVGQRVESTVLYNNYGNYYTGDIQYGLMFKMNEISNTGDYIFISGVSGNNSKNLVSGSFMYNTPIGKDGDTLNISYADTSYLLGQQFSILNSTGIANSASISWKRALLRSKKHNINFAVNYQNKDLYDRIGFSSYSTNKRVEEINLTYSESMIDDKGGGYSAYSLTYNYGNLSGDANAMSSATPGAPGDYATAAMTYNRYKRFAPRFSYMVNINAQWANENLNSSEKMTLGGPYGVRAYPAGEASGDSGVMGQVEFYYHFPSKNDVRLVAFFDAGKVDDAKGYLGSQGSQSCAGYGIGFIWNSTDDINIRVDYAWKSNPNQLSTAAPNQNGILWWQGTYKF